MVNEERFEAFWTRQDISRTWFCSLEVSNRLESTGVMLNFGRSTELLHALEPSAAPVSCSLSLGGQYSGTWRQLIDEPVRLREIGYAKGKLLFVDYDGEEIEGDVSEIFDELIYDLLSM